MDKSQLRIPTTRALLAPPQVLLRRFPFNKLVPLDNDFFLQAQPIQCLQAAYSWQRHIQSIPVGLHLRMGTPRLVSPAPTLFHPLSPWEEAVDWMFEHVEAFPDLLQPKRSRTVLPEIAQKFGGKRDTPRKKGEGNDTVQVVPLAMAHRCMMASLMSPSFNLQVQRSSFAEDLHPIFGIIEGKVT